MEYIQISMTKTIVSFCYNFVLMQILSFFKNHEIRARINTLVPVTIFSFCFIKFHFYFLFVLEDVFVQGSFFMFSCFFFFLKCFYCFCGGIHQIDIQHCIFLKPFYFWAMANKESQRRLVHIPLKCKRIIGFLKEHTLSNCM